MARAIAVTNIISSKHPDMSTLTEKLELGLGDVQISKVLSNDNVTLHNGWVEEVVDDDGNEEEDEEDDDDIDAYILKQSGYSNSTTIKKPYHQPIKGDDDDGDITDDIPKQSGYSNEDDDITSDYGSMKKQYSTPKLAAPVKLISAMKGSREKEGIPTRNLSVTWSPDVYDPIPSPDTFVRIKIPRPKSDSKRIQMFKKNGKPIGKDKGKPSKGRSSRKDKKVK